VEISSTIDQSQDMTVSWALNSNATTNATKVLSQSNQDYQSTLTTTKPTLENTNSSDKNAVSVQPVDPQKKDWKQRLSECTWRHKNFTKVVHTIILYTIMLGMGSMHTVVGPTLLDLAFKLDASVSEISIVYTTQGIGFIIGTAMGGLLIDIFPKMLFLVVSTGITALVTISIPHWPTIWSMCICFFLRGTSIRALEIGCNVALLDLWSVESSRPMQGLHFFLAIGCAIGPLLVQPFLGDSVKRVVVHNQTDTIPVTSGSNLTTIGPVNPVEDSVGQNKIEVFNDLTSSRIEVAYLVIGAYLGCIAIISLITYAVSSAPLSQSTPIRDRMSSGNDNDDDASLSQREKRQKRKFIAKFICCGTIILFLYFGSILSFDSYLTTFCVESKLRMSQSRGAVLSTIFWCAFVLARLIACVYAGMVSDLKIIIIDLIGIVISSIPLSIFVEQHEWVIWTCVIVYGFFMASLGPAAISYTNMFINVSGKIAAIYMLGAAVGETLAPFLIGKLFEMEPMVLMYTVTSISILLLPLTFFKVRLAHKQGKKPTAQKETTSLARRLSRSLESRPVAGNRKNTPINEVDV